VVSQESAGNSMARRVARKLAKQQQGSDGFIWAQLAKLWDKVADRKAAKEAQVLASSKTDNSPATEDEAKGAISSEANSTKLVEL